MKKKNIFTLVIAAVLVVSLAVVFTACNNEPEKPEVPETTEVSTTEQEIPVIEEDTTEEETVKETEKETVKETEKETEKVTEKETEKETEKVTQKPVSNSGSGNKTETPKKDTPKKDNTETTKKPSSSNSNKNDSSKNDSGATGGIDWSSAGKGPDTKHVGGESSEEAESAAQAAIDKNGWNMDWELS